MSKLPLTYTITLTALEHNYVATVTAWGVPDIGGYGSLWSRTLALPGALRTAGPSLVLAELAAAIAFSLGPA